MNLWLEILAIVQLEDDVQGRFTRIKATITRQGNPSGLAEQSEQQRCESRAGWRKAGGDLKALRIYCCHYRWSEYIHKLSQKAAAKKLRFEYNSNAVEALRSDDKYVQAAGKLSQQGALGTGQLRKYPPGRGVVEITSIEMGDALTNVKKYDAGVAWRCPLEVAGFDAIGKGQQAYGVSRGKS